MDATNERERQRAILVDNSRWDWWPFCPLSRPSDIPGTGIRMRERGFMRAKIAERLLIILVPIDLAGELTPEQIDTYPHRLQYTSVDELLDDGWSVD